MRINELMIGDLVYLKYFTGRRPCKVTPQVFECGAHWSLAHIPLTAEILEKNGFVKANSQRYDWGDPDGFYVSVNPKRKMIHINGANGSNVNMYYKFVGFYVHTLQHALRLCGLNELAEDFKV